MNDTQELTQKNKTDSRPEQSRKISDLFGENIFDLKTLKQYVSEDTYQEMKGTMLKQQKIKFSTAEQMAKGMIGWAMEKDVTHFTHWFQPLTESAAEKHDSFFKPSFASQRRSKS